jgi:hypothetical protein
MSPVLAIGLSTFCCPLPVVAAPAISKCQYKAAHYTLIGYPDVTAQFQTHGKLPDVPTDVFFRIHTKSRGWDFWYMPDAGNGYSTVELISIDDPAGRNWQAPYLEGGRAGPNLDEKYFGIESNLEIRTDIPIGKNLAPAYIFVPDFGMHVWYDPKTINSHSRYWIPRALFRLDRCGP